MKQEMTFKEATAYAKRMMIIRNPENLKVVQGSKTGMFYFIGRTDRDYNTNFSVTCKQFVEGIMPENCNIF